ncbi:MAG: HAD family hydrolase [Candidatus Hodarchaeales archaeon]|jgi:HAD superfamily hydrolase (TIGR01509 family)
MPNYIVPPHIKGIIFDCDGVLVDSEPFSCQALNIVFEKHFGIDIGNDYTPVIGTSLKDTISYYFDKYNIKYQHTEELLIEKDVVYQEIAKNNLKSFEGITLFLKDARMKNYKISVASSGTEKKINFSLTEAKLIDYFDFITSSSEVKKGKPEPDLFLKAAEKMTLDPSLCMVFEDSFSGIEAAKKAGMYVIGITNTFSYEKLSKTQANIILNSISEMSTP